MNTKLKYNILYYQQLYLFINKMYNRFWSECYWMHNTKNQIKSLKTVNEFNDIYSMKWLSLRITWRIYYNLYASKYEIQQTSIKLPGCFIQTRFCNSLGRNQTRVSERKTKMGNVSVKRLTVKTSFSSLRIFHKKIVKKNVKKKKSN